MRRTRVRSIAGLVRKRCRTSCMAYMEIAGGRRREASARTGLPETRRLGNCFTRLFDFTGSLKLFHVEQF